LFNRKSEIVFIGAGKVAHTLVPLLIEKKYSVKGIISKNLNSAKSLAGKYKIKFYSDNISDVPYNSKMVFITVPDNQVSLVAKKLSHLILDFKNSLFVHTSGSEGSEALKSIKQKGGRTASFHIMQTFPSLKRNVIKNSFAAVETNDKSAESFLLSFAKNLELKTFKLNSESKVYYHLAGVFTANFLNANFFSSEKLLSKTSLNRKEYFNLFEPIVNSTLSNIKKSGVANSLSGPVQRGDYLTVKKHLAAIKKSKLKEKKIILQSYVSQSLLLLEIIKKKKGRITEEQVEVKKILDREL
jgi:predicted short-subunit dehydrogenase-like oxidoreductase (DUF2520 family)